MVVRQMTNYPDSPLRRADGSPAEGTQVTIRLCVGDSDPDPTTVEYGGTWDAYTSEPIISSPITKLVDAAGFFVFDLWPNDRGSSPTQYLFSVSETEFAPFISSIPSAPQEAPGLVYSFFDFFTTANHGALVGVGSVTPVLDTLLDGIPYCRKNRDWVPVPVASDAPIDGEAYNRKNGEWTKTAEFLVPTTGTPSGFLLPAYTGQDAMDTTTTPPTFYKSFGLGVFDWAQLNNVSILAPYYDGATIEYADEVLGDSYSIVFDNGQLYPQQRTPGVGTVSGTGVYYTDTSTHLNYRLLVAGGELIAEELGSISGMVRGSNFTYLDTNNNRSYKVIITNGAIGGEEV